jgi:hypothetical protein
VKYELGFYIPEDGILHSHRRENLTSYSRGVIHPAELFYLSPFLLCLRYFFYIATILLSETAVAQSHQ